MTPEERAGVAESPGSPPPLQGWTETVASWVCGIALILMLAITAVEVAGRALFNFSLQITEDLCGYLLVAITFLSLGYSQVNNAFHRIEFIQGRLTARGRQWLNLVFLLVSIAFLAGLTWYLGAFALDAWESGDVAPSVVQTPMWIPQAAMPLGTALLLVSLVKTAIASIRTLGAGSAGAHVEGHHP